MALGIASLGLGFDSSSQAELIGDEMGMQGFVVHGELQLRKHTCGKWSS